MSSPREMSGAQRAAAFLFSLDKNAAANVIKHIDETVIVEVVEAMGHLEPGMVGGEMQRQLDKELVKSLHKPRAARIRSDAELHTMLEQTLGKQQAASLFEKIRERLLQERPFFAMENHAPESIAKVLASESNAVAALVLAHLDPSLSADVLAKLDSERALLLVKRMATLVPPGFETLVAIAQDLSKRLETLASGPVAPHPSVRLKTIAEVMNYSQPEVEKVVLEGIDKENAQMAAEIREFMFTWENLADVDKRAMQKILASVQTRTLAVALKACSEPVEANIMNNLSQRVREMLRDERELAGPMPMKEVLAARAEIMRAVRELMGSGEFSPAKAGEELVT
jgi:flagellar motor switch protein FliG